MSELFKHLEQCVDEHIDDQASRRNLASIAVSLKRIADHFVPAQGDQLSQHEFNTGHGSA